ncbi:inner membrane protein YhjD [Haloechinothrix sp. LS1_15]|uniref:inner membrane protein YhjD n=1 Tax=Haloechinothrix sp. LS1_15 TaxID=2652248 RepID=UPI002947F7DC|nr:inner membrane protein YhjD [Haloechinothrix sp. LS1_15]MDV6012992.1 inner membrane protein YhjD [Haloechinothrix sp. LS1_15]
MRQAKEKAQEVSERAQRLRRRYPGIDHLIRAQQAFGDRYGNHYAAAITYFSVLSLVPLLMVAFAIASYVLAADPALLQELITRLVQAAPDGLEGTIEEVVLTAVEARTTVGVLGLAVALYSGIGWMRNLRDALTAQWGQERKKRPLVSGMAKDLLALLGLGAALLVSFGLTTAGTMAARAVLATVGLEDVTPARVGLSLLTIVLAIAANWLVFLWVIARLPRERVSARSAVKGALIAAIGFELLKQLASLFIASVMTSPTGALFGPIIGLLVFANVVSRFLLFVTAWTATARENVVETVPEPGPTMVRPLVHVRRGPSAGHVAGLVGLGAALGGAASLLSRRRRDRTR